MQKGGEIEMQKGEIQVKLLSIALVGLVIIFLLLILPSLLGFRTVDAGEVAVVTKFGATTGRVLEPGAHFIVPFIEGTKTLTTRTMTYETADEANQKTSQADYRDYPVDTNTKDGQRVDIYYTVRFFITPVKAVDIINNFGSEKTLVEGVVKTDSRSVIRIIPSQFTADELYVGEGKEKLASLILNEMKQDFESKGLILDAIRIREIKFTDQYVKAIEDKQIAAVNVQTEKNIAEQATYKKQAAITEAEAQAKAQELQRQTISPELLQKLMIEKWDGHYPQYYIAGQSGQFILPLPQK